MADTAEQIRTGYLRRIKHHESDINLLSRRLKLISLYRFISFVLILTALFIAQRLNVATLIAGELILVSVFLFLVRAYMNLSARRSFSARLLRINRDEVRGLEGKWTEFNGGSEFMDPDHPYAADLDIFGNNSLFQYLNRTCGSTGRDQLAAWLRGPGPSGELKLRQQAVRELSSRTDWRQEFQATGNISPELEHEAKELAGWVKSEDRRFLTRKWMYLLVVLPALTLISLFLVFFSLPWSIPIFLVLVQLGIVSLNLRHINHHHNQIGKKYKLLRKYRDLFGLCEREQWDETLLRRLREDLSVEGRSVSERISRLASISDSFDRRLNMLAGFILDALLMWDLQCIVRLEKWKAENRDLLPAWIRVLGIFDALSSLANYAYNNPGYCYPGFHEEYFHLRAEAMSHPLLSPQERVHNDVTLGNGHRFMLITGSNMAGKSTFLRTTGINLVLAQAGAPVCASDFAATPVMIYTSMRITDSLLSRESTFYAELKKMNRIINAFSSGEQAFVLLDEILKGTNSRDKHYGSEMLIRQLVDLRAAGMIATHDLELGGLEQELDGAVKNYCFEVQIRDARFFYDFKLKQGVACTLNATELMKQMGIRISQ